MMQYSVCDMLIFVLSHRGTMTVRGDGGFLAAYECLVEDHISRSGGQCGGDDFPQGWDMLRDLEEMGYLRCQQDEVIVEPPHLVKCADKPNRAVLTGARTLGILEILSEQVATAITTDLCMPSHIVIAGADDDLSDLAGHVGLGFASQPLAYTVALNARPICTAASDLVFQNTELGDGRRWFNSASLRYDGKPPTQSNEFGLARFDHHGVRFELYHRCADHIEVCADVDPAIGKWMMMRQSGATLAYDSCASRVAIPHFAQLPRNLARALALCTCLPPVMRVDREAFDTSPLRVYERVPPVIAGLVSEKLGCKLESVNLETLEEMTCKTLLDLSTRFATTS